MSCSEEAHVLGLQRRAQSRSPFTLFLHRACCRSQGASAGAAGGLGISGIVEKLLGLFKKEEGRDLQPGKEADYSKLSALAKQYLHMDISADTLKTHVSSFLGKFQGGGTVAAPTAPAGPAGPAIQAKPA